MKLKTVFFIIAVIVIGSMFFGCAEEDYSQDQKTGDSPSPTEGMSKDDPAADEYAEKSAEEQNKKIEFLYSLGTRSTTEIEMKGRYHSFTQYDDCDLALENFNKAYPNAIDDFMLSIEQQHPELFSGGETSFPHPKDLSKITDYEEISNYSLIAGRDYISPNTNSGAVDENILTFLHYYVGSHKSRITIDFIQQADPNSMSDSEFEEFYNEALANGMLFRP